MIIWRPVQTLVTWNGLLMAGAAGSSFHVPVAACVVLIRARALPVAAERAAAKPRATKRLRNIRQARAGINDERFFIAGFLRRWAARRLPGCPTPERGPAARPERSVISTLGRPQAGGRASRPIP